VNTARPAWFLLVLLSGLALGALPGTAQSNVSPIASFSVRSSDDGGATSVILDASASYDPDGRIVSFQWLFGDGFTGSGMTRTHTFPTIGEYQVTLLVTDDRGGTNMVRRTIDLSRPIEPESAPIDTVPAQSAIPVGVKVGFLAPEFALPGLDGGIVRLSDYLGRPIIIDFWSSACSACRAAAPHLESLRRSYADRDLVAIVIALDPTPSDAARFLAAGGYTEFVVAREIDPSRKETMHLYGVGQIPHAFLVDRGGVIRYSGHLNRLSAEGIDPWI